MMASSYQDALAFYQIDSAHPGGFRLTKSLLKKENLKEGMTVLDAGCGTGKTSLYLAENFPCTVYALDLHPEMIMSAGQRFHQAGVPVKLYQGSMEDMPFEDNFFDLILAESTAAFTEVKKSLSEFHRTLKPGGSLVNIDMAAEHNLPQTARTVIASFYQLKQLLSEQEWKASLKKAGFSSVKTLQGNTVLGELMRTPPSEQTILPAVRNPQLERVMQEHQTLTLQYGNMLGYRVFKSKK